MSDPSEPSFDLSVARGLSRKLAGLSDQAGAARLDYIAWSVEPTDAIDSGPATESAMSPGASASVSSASAPVPSSPAVMPNPSSLMSAPRCESLEELLAWALNVTRFESAFIVDPQGFVISVAGSVADNFFENTGAALSFATEQLRQVNPTESLLSAELGYADTHILAIPGNEAAIKEYLIAFLGDSVLDRDTIRALSLELRHRLKELI